MTSTNTQMLQANLELIVERDPDLMSLFYATFFKRYPEVVPLFGRNSQSQQEQMLAEALTMLVGHLDDEGFVENTMLAVGRKHLDYGVEDKMYAWVGECLLSTLADVSGDDWTPALEGAWSGVLNAIAQIAIRGAAEARAEAQAAPATSA